MINFLFVGIFGALGAMTRYGTGLLMIRLFGESFPWGTLCVNVVGCFALGMLKENWLPLEDLHGSLRIGLAVGLLGALTTFSTFSYETVALIELNRPIAAAANIVANLVVGLSAVGMGVLFARSFTPLV
jgi:CrcB protein